MKKIILLQILFLSMFYIFSKIFSSTSKKIFSFKKFFSSSEKFPKTKSAVQKNFNFSSSFTQIFNLLKSSFQKNFIMSFIQLCPQALHFSRKRIFQKSKSLSS